MCLREYEWGLFVRVGSGAVVSVGCHDWAFAPALDSCGAVSAGFGGCASCEQVAGVCFVDCYAVEPCEFVAYGFAGFEGEAYVCVGCFGVEVCSECFEVVEVVV